MSLFQTLLSRSGLFDPSFLYGNSDQMDAESNTQMDWKETRDAHIFEIDLPGVTKEDVKLQVREGRVLCIRAERREEEEEQQQQEQGEEEKDEEKKKLIKWHCKERGISGVFSREFRLPENAKVDDVKASMRDGVLTITVSKDQTKKKHKHHKKEVHISHEGDDDGVAANKGIGRFVCCKA